MTTRTNHKPRSTLNETKHLADTIVASLRADPCTVNELARAMGFSATYLRSRLDQLRAEGRIVRAPLNLLDGGMEYIWSVAPAMAARDPLVAALFGPAQREAA